MKTTDTKKGKKKDLKKCAISVKAYNDFTSRIRSAFEYDNLISDEVMQMLDLTVGYSDEPIDLEFCSPEAKIAYLMIKPEIEKAIKRSQAARERAAERKRNAATKAVAADTADNATEQPEEKDAPINTQQPLETEIERNEKPSAEVETIPQATPPLSRSKRRKMRRQAARLRREATMKTKQC
jgi:hypothetical protein